jgi:glycosyltransferase involved in cell wall biosynthesis
MKILHATETAQGGVGTYIDEVIALQLQRYGARQVRVVVPQAHAQQLRSLPDEVQNRFASGRGRLGRVWQVAWTTLAEVKRWQPDVVHLHSTFAGFVLRPLLAWRAPRTRVVYCAHGWAFDRDSARWVCRLIEGVERVWSRWSDTVLCISRNDWEAGRRIGIPEERLALIQNGIRKDAPVSEAAVEQARQRWPQGKLRLLFVGRLDRQKGVDRLFEIVRRLGAQAHTVVVGAAVVADNAETPPEHLQITGWLPRDEIAAYCAAADVLLMPSRWEGLPLVALEAMRMGCPVVASPAGGLPEVIEHGVTGYLIDGADPDAWVRTLQNLDPDTQHRLGEAGRRLFNAQFTLDRVVTQLDALYGRLVGGQAPASAAAPTPATQEGTQTTPPLVSIVVCSYNYDKYVEAAIRSALAQTHARTEVIVVDDGSTDTSQERLMAWRDKVRLILQPNGGQLSAYNTGFAAAQGEFIVFLDADDMLDPDMVVRALPLFEEGVARVHYRLRLIGDDGTPTGQLIPRHLATGDVRDELVRRGHLFASAPGSGNIYRRAALTKLMPLPVTTDRHGADYFTIYGTALCGRLAAVPEPAGSYRIQQTATAQENLVFGNASQSGNEAEKVRLRGERFKQWIHERLGVRIEARLLDFGNEKQAYALSIFNAKGYLAGLKKGCGRFPNVVRAICLKRSEPWWLRMGLIGWAWTILWLPRSLGWPLARRVCNPGSR